MFNVNEIKWLKDDDPEYILDPLTGVINRNFIVKIANGLIEEKTPFAMMILDLDNFKQINDSYGHLEGDYILKTIGEALVKEYAPDIYIGRYGGDELILLVPNLKDYDDVHNFLEGLYAKNKIFRRYYNDKGIDIYLTATLGCSKYPSDGDNYEDLFKKADKALYRGKTKGRNCYIIYVESKHKDIVVREKAEGSLIEHLNAVIRLFDIYKGDKIIKHTMDFLYSELHSSGVMFLTNDNKIISNKNGNPKLSEYNYKPHLEILLKEDKVFYATPLTKYKIADPVLRDFLESHSVQSILIVKLETFNDFKGFIMVYEKEITRVWQESEVALVMYAAALLELQMNHFKK